MENEIKLVQKPIIKHQLELIGKSVTDRLEELNIENQVATADTIQSLKKLRAELNHESKEWIDQLKLVVDPAMQPILELKEKFKEEITLKYGNADAVLKEKISSFEMTIKEEKEANLKVYFIELCQSEEIDFITFDKLNLDINLSTTEKKYKEQINEFVQKVCSDIDLIKTQEYEAEIMAEYKANLNVSQSIQNVNLRKQREQEEKDRIKAQENLRRSTALKNIGMKFDDMTKSFAYNDDIYISENVVNDFEKSEFLTKFIELEEKIKADKKANETTETKHPVQTEIKPEIKEPLKAPVKEEKQELVTAQFEAIGTYAQLKALGQYMKENNITYKNI